MKLLYGLSGFFPFSKAGTENYVLNLAKELLNLGYKVSVITPAVGEKQEFYNYEGIDVYGFFVPRKISTAELSGLKEPSGINEFRLLLKKIKPDIFHMHSLSRSLHAEHLHIASETGIKTVFTAHLGGNFCVRGDLMLFGEKQCDGRVEKQRCLSCFIQDQKNMSKSSSKVLSHIINTFITKSFLINLLPAFRIVDYKKEQLVLLKKNVDAYISIASWLQHLYSINGLNNVILIRQAINSDIISTNSSEIKYETKIQLIFVGRMHPLKNIEILFDAIQALTDFFNLTIVTIPFEDEINYYNSIKERYSRLNYKNWFENLTNREVAEKLEQSNILILPSRFEAAPLVILEAFAKKVPVIGSDYPAIKEMIEHNTNGLLFKNGDAQSLKEQLLRLINEPNLIRRLSNNITSVRTFKEVAKEHHELYKNLLGKKQ